jgi:HEAT repeat protein
MKATVEYRLAILEHAASSQKTGMPVELLTRAMHDPSPSVRSKAVQIASQFDMKAAIPFVEQLLSDRSEQVRLGAVGCLGLLGEGSTASCTKLRALLKDPSFLVRIETLETLVQLGDQDALPAVSRLLCDENPLVRAYAARSIAGLDGTSYGQAIYDALAAEKEDSARVGFLEALFLLGNRDVFEALLRDLAATDYRVRCAVANALEDMPLSAAEASQATQALEHAEANALGKADRSTAARVLAALRTDRDQASSVARPPQ